MKTYEQKKIFRDTEIHILTKLEYKLNYISVIDNINYLYYKIILFRKNAFEFCDAYYLARYISVLCYYYNITSLWYPSKIACACLFLAFKYINSLNDNVIKNYDTLLNNWIINDRYRCDTSDCLKDANQKFEPEKMNINEFSEIINLNTQIITEYNDENIEGYKFRDYIVIIRKIINSVVNEPLINGYIFDNNVIFNEHNFSCLNLVDFESKTFYTEFIQSIDNYLFSEENEKYVSPDISDHNTTPARTSYFSENIGPYQGIKIDMIPDLSGLSLKD